MSEVARVFKASRQNAMPFLPEIHTSDEDADYFTNVVFAENHVYVAIELKSERIIGFIAFRDEWVNHLYILPQFQKFGLGSKLLALAKQHAQSLELWTFQKNLVAQCFYEKHGFIVIKRTDGTGNEEKEPDVLLRWKK